MAPNPLASLYKAHDKPVKNFAASYVAERSTRQNQYASQVSNASLPLDNMPDMFRKLNGNPERTWAKCKERKMRIEKARPLSSRERQRLGIFCVPKHTLKAADFVALNKLWTAYMRELRGADTTSDAHFLPKLVHADFHGARLKVVRSKCPGFVGAEGVVYRDSALNFHLVRDDDTTVTVPKRACVFAFVLDSKKYTLYGSQFAYSPTARFQRKFKSRASIDL